MKPAVFFDRDGVVNVSPGQGYVTRLEDFHFMPGIVPVLSWCRAQGLFTVLVTSQQGVGKGLMTAGELEKIHQWMQRELNRAGAAFDRIHSCTHVAGHCGCRKPSPQMILEAASALPIDLPASVLVGDHDRDILMARNAGVGTAIRFAGEDHPVREAGDAVVRNAEELLAVLKDWDAHHRLERRGGEHHGKPAGNPG